MFIGNVKLNNNIFLAPMAGITDLPFRIMCKKYGAGLVYTEMVSSKALFYNDKKTMSLIETNEQEKPFAVQIFGSDPDIMAKTAYKALCTGASIIDINMGCPAPKVANNGDGSALLNNPELIGKIVKSVSEAVDVPVTCKIRSGFNQVADVEYIAKTIEQNGAAAITVHPRTREMYYSGTADRSIIKLVKQSVSIPVIGIGAGGGCDGQVLVMHDMLGINKGFSPRFLRRYADVGTIINDAVAKYVDDVKTGDFPNESEQY